MTGAIQLTAEGAQNSINLVARTPTAKRHARSVSATIRVTYHVLGDKLDFKMHVVLEPFA
jgi:hypothetical protein